MLFELLIYDVWGNDQDGFEVNAVRSTGDYIELHDTMDDVDIMTCLVNAGLANKNCITKIKFDGDFHDSLYGAWIKNDQPAFELRRQNLDNSVQ